MEGIHKGGLISEKKHETIGRSFQEFSPTPHPLMNYSGFWNVFLGGRVKLG